MKSLIVLVAICIMATPAFPVVDPEPDMMGIYFDRNADVNCLTIGPSIPFEAYLIVTNSSYSGIDAYEFGLELAIPLGFEGMIFRLASNSEGTEWIDPTTVSGGDYIVGLPVPIPTAPATVLHRLQYMLLTEMPVEYYLGSVSVPSIPGDLPVVQVDNSVLIQVGLSTGGPEIPVATVNTDCVVNTEGFTFGSVKALYR